MADDTTDDEDAVVEEELSDLDWNLFVAVEQNDAAAVQQALQDGANVNCVDRDCERTPLMTAIQWRLDHEIVSLLLEKGADARWKGQGGQSAISAASESGQWSTVELLINHDKDLVDITDDSGSTPLFEAINYGPANAVRFLIKNGANVHAITDITSKESTTLMQACRREGSNPAIEIVRLLVDAKVDVNAGDEVQQTALHFAIEHGGSVETIRFLLENGASANTSDVDGYTPLMVACRERKEDIVRWLLDAKADASARDSSQQTALHVAAAHGKIGILRQLILKFHANIFAVDEQGSTPFDCAVRTVALFLIGLYCTKMTQDHDRLALHAILCSATYSFGFQDDNYILHPPLKASLQIRLQLGKLTIENWRTLLHSLDTELIRSRDDIGKLPIHIACQANAPVEVLSMLVEIDPATLQSADHNGALPIHYLLLSGSRDGPPIDYFSVQYLVEQGGIGTLTARTTQYGFLPLHSYLSASKLPSLRIVQYLIQSAPVSVAARTYAGQYPFLMAACETSLASLSVVYELVRANPALVVPR